SPASCRWSSPPSLDGSAPRSLRARRSEHIQRGAGEGGTASAWTRRTPVPTARERGCGEAGLSGCRGTGRQRQSTSAVVHELEGDLEVLALQQRDHGLQVVAALGGDAQLVALDPCLDALGALVPDDLRD